MRRNKKSLWVILFFLFSINLFSQSIEDYGKELSKEFSKGNYERALEIAFTIKNMAETNSGKSSYSYINSLQNIVTIYRTIGDVVTAEEYLKEILLQIETLPNKDELLTGRVYLQLGGIYEKKNLENESLQYIQRGIELFAKILGRNSVEYNNALTILAGTKNHFGYVEEAKKLFQEALDFFAKVKPDDPSIELSALNNLAIIEQRLKNYNTAETLFVKTLSLAEGSLGNTSQYYLTVVFNLSSFYLEVNKPDKADSLVNKLIQIYRFHSLSNHRAFVEVLLLKANCEKKLNRFNQAEKVLNEAKTLLEEKNILGSEIGAKVFLALGQINSSIGNYVEALKNLEKSYFLFEKIEGKKGRNFITSLSEILIASINLNLTKEVEPYYLTSRNIIDTDSIGKRELLMLSNASAQYLIRQNNFIESKKIITRVLNKNEIITADNFNVYLTLTQLNILLGDFKYADSILNSLSKWVSINCDTISVEYFSVISAKAKFALQKMDFASALSFTKKAKTIAESLFETGSQTIMDVDYTLAECYRALGKFYDAKELYEKVLNVISNENINLKVKYNVGYGLLLMEMGDITSADTVFNYLAFAGKKVLGEQSIEYNTIIFHIAELNKSKWNFSLADSLFNKAINTLSLILDQGHPLIQRIRNNYLQLLITQGLYSSALNELSLLLSNYVKPDTSLLYSSILGTAGYLFIQMGDYITAENYIGQAQNIVQRLLGSKNKETALLLNNKAYLYSQIGKFEESEKMYFNILKLYEEIGGKEQFAYALTLNNIAEIYSHQNMIIKADSCFSLSLSILFNLFGEKNINYANTLINRGGLLYKQEKYSDAIPLLENAAKIYLRLLGEHHPNYAITIQNLGTVYLNLKKYTEAKNLLLKASELNELMLGKNHPNQSILWSNLGILFDELNEVETAKGYFLLATDNLMEQIDKFFNFLNEKEQTIFIKKVKRDLSLFNLFALKRLNELPELIDKLIYNHYKTKDLVVSSNKKLRDAVYDSNNNELIKKYEQLKTLRETLSGVYSMTTTERNQKKISIEELEKQNDELEKEIYSTLKLSNEKTITDIGTCRTIQEMLDNNEAMVIMLRISETALGMNDSIIYSAIVIRKELNEPIVFSFRNGFYLENQAYKNYRSSIENKKSTNDAYELYWEKINNVLKGCDIIYFSSDGIYSQINIETLQKEDGKFVFDDSKIINIQNILGFKTKEIFSLAPENSIYLFGYPNYNLNPDIQSSLVSSLPREKVEIENFDATKSLDIKKIRITDLPGTKREIESINKILSQKKFSSKVFVGNEALEERVKLISSPSILHIATHGFFLEESDDFASMFIGLQTAIKSGSSLNRSGLLLAGAKRGLSGINISGLDNGILTAYEVKNLSLNNTYLTVLSACETGVGDIGGFEGVSNLPKAFKAAGSKYVIMSLWKVDDKTTMEFMELFYRNLTDGIDFQQAVYTAKNEIRKKYNSPYYWGAFILIGD